MGRVMMRFHEGDPAVTIDELFALPVTEVLDSPVTADMRYPWDRDAYYCSDCLEAFIQTRLLTWVLYEKVKVAGASIVKLYMRTSAN